jgi:hypothetical protein
MLEYPKCPRCGKTGTELTLVGKQDRNESFPGRAPQLAMLFAYQCPCGITFTHTLWDERAANSFL